MTRGIHAKPVMSEELKPAAPGQDAEVCGTCRRYGHEVSISALGAAPPVYLPPNMTKVGICCRREPQREDKQWTTPITWPERPGCEGYVRAEIRRDR